LIEETAMRAISMMPTVLIAALVAGCDSPPSRSRLPTGAEALTCLATADEADDPFDQGRDFQSRTDAIEVVPLAVEKCDGSS
jgi:hypothetical protein